MSFKQNKSKNPHLICHTRYYNNRFEVKIASDVSEKFSSFNNSNWNNIEKSWSFPIMDSNIIIQCIKDMGYDIFENSHHFIY